MRTPAATLLLCALASALMAAGMLGFEYLDQRFQPIGLESGFRFAAERGHRVYPPSQTVWLQDERVETNRHGLWGAEPLPGQKLLLVLGASTSMRYARHLDDLAGRDGVPLRLWSGARWHNTERETLLQFEELSREVRFDGLLLMAGQVFFRDIDHYHRDIHAIPDGVIRQQAFSWWSGGPLAWRDYWLMARVNQFHYAEDNAAVRRVFREGPPTDDPEPLVRRSLDLYSRDLGRLADLAASRGARLVLLTSPLARDRNSAAQAALMERFNDATRAVAGSRGLGLVDLYRHFDATRTHLFKDRFHWNEDGDREAAAAILPRLREAFPAAAAR